MKRFKQKTLCYAVLAVLLMSSLSACGPWIEYLETLCGGIGIAWPNRQIGIGSPIPGEW